MLIEFDNLRARISDATEGELRALRLNYRTYAPGYKYDWRYKKKMWDGRVSIFNSRDNSLPSGWLPKLAQEFPHARFVDRRPLPQIQLQPTRVSLRDYQAEVVQTAFSNQSCGTWWPRGVIQAATGSGKSIMAAAMIDMTHQLKTLFVVHRTQLKLQTERVFEQFNVRTKNVKVVTVQSLMSWAYDFQAPIQGERESEEEFEERLAQFQERKERRDEKADLQRAYLESIQQVFIDEAHLVAANQEKGNLFSRAL